MYTYCMLYALMRTDTHHLQYSIHSHFLILSLYKIQFYVRVMVQVGTKMSIEGWSQWVTVRGECRDGSNLLEKDTLT